MGDPTSQPVSAPLVITIEAAVFLTVSGLLVLLGALVFNVESYLPLYIVVIGMTMKPEAGRDLRSVWRGLKRIPLALGVAGAGAGALALLPPAGPLFLGLVLALAVPVALVRKTRERRRASPSRRPACHEQS